MIKGAGGVQELRVREALETQEPAIFRSLKGSPRTDVVCGGARREGQNRGQEGSERWKDTAASAGSEHPIPEGV